MFHKEGFKIIIGSFFIIGIAALLAQFYLDNFYLQKGIQLLLLLLLITILQFFRNPKRPVQLDNHQVVAPVDGKVVVIEEVFEREYFKEKRIQVSIFMSPVNVHVTRYAVGGLIKYSKYHPGKFLVAWHPKSSEENERTTVVVDNPTFGEILYRQIAGALAKRIVNYAKEGETVVQGTDAGFIKFGSRVDLFLPLDSDIKVQLHQKVKGGIDIIAAQK